MIDRCKEFSSDFLRNALQGFVVAVVYYCLMRLGYAMASFSNLPIIAPAYGLAFAVIFLLGRGIVPLLFAADLLAQWAIQSVPGASFSLAMPAVALGNILGVALGVETLRIVVRGETVFDAPRYMLLFLLAAIPAAACIVMLGHLSMFMFNNMLWDSNLSRLIAASLISTGIGIMLVAPFVMACGARSRGAHLSVRSSEVLAIFAALFLLSWLIFGSAFAGRFEGYPLLLAFLPIVLLAAIRLDSRQFTGLSVLLGGIVLVGTVSGRGPFASAYLADSLLLLQSYLGAMAGTALVLHCVVRESRMFESQLEQSYAALGVATRALDKRASKQFTELAQERNRLRCMLDTMSEAHAQIAADGHFLEVNPALCRLSGYSRNELLTRHLSDLFPHCPLPPTDPALFPGGGDPVSFQANLIQAHSTVVPCRVHACGHYEDDQWLGYLLFISDIALEQQAAAQRRDIERIAGLNLKFPLDALAGAVGQLRTVPGLTEAHDQPLCEIGDILDQIQIQTIGTLDFLRLECGVCQLQRGPVDLIALIDMLARQHQPVHPGRSFRILLFGKPLSDSDTYFVHGDQPFLRIMLDALLQYAFSVAPPENVIRIELDEDDQRYTCGAHTIAIHHRGVIPDSLRDRFWVKYALCEHDADLNPGPYLARVIAEAHGGQVNFTSSQSRGTTLNVLLPVLAPRR